MLLYAFLALVASVASAQACDACIDGLCHWRETIVSGFEVSDQMAIDRKNRILYLLSNSNRNIAVYPNDLKIHLVQALNSTGLAVNQKNGVLYTADDQKDIPTHKLANGVEVNSLKTHQPAKLLYYANSLHYTIKDGSGLYFLEDGVSLVIEIMNNYNITDFVVTDRGEDKLIYFVSGKRVYKFHKNLYIDPELVAEKEYKLGIDKNDDVYLLDPSMNVILKLNSTGYPVEHAVYKTGSVDRMVFDGINNIIFHDSKDGTLNYWKPGGGYCRIDAPHENYAIIDEIRRSS